MTTTWSLQKGKSSKIRVCHENDGWKNFWDSNKFFQIFRLLRLLALLRYRRIQIDSISRFLAICHTTIMVGAIKLSFFNSICGDSVYTRKDSFDSSCVPMRKHRTKTQNVILGSFISVCQSTCRQLHRHVAAVPIWRAVRRFSRAQDEIITLRERRQVGLECSYMSHCIDECRCKATCGKH